MQKKINRPCRSCLHKVWEEILDHC